MSMTTTKAQTAGQWAYCPECGCAEIHHAEGAHKQCERCGQEWFADIDYSDVVQKHLSTRDRLKEINAELLAALIGLLPQTFTGAPDRKNEIAHWERERALGNGRAPLVLAAFAAISRATVTP